MACFATIDLHYCLSFALSTSMFANRFSNLDDFEQLFKDPTLPAGVTS